MKKTLLIAGIAALTTAPLIAQGMMGHDGHGGQRHGDFPEFSMGPAIAVHRRHSQRRQATGYDWPRAARLIGHMKGTAA